MMRTERGRSAKGDESGVRRVANVYNPAMPPTAKKRRARWNWLLLLPLAALIFPGLYTRNDPVLLGFPFFYWYQFAAVLVTALLTGTVYLLTRE